MKTIKRSAPPERRRKIGLMGASLDTGNRGVSALCASSVTIINRIYRNAAYYLFIGNRSNAPQVVKLPDKEIPLQVINYRLSLRAKLNQHLFWILFLAVLQRCIPFQAVKSRIIASNPYLDHINRMDFIGEIFGGDSFSDIYGIKRYLLEVMNPVIVLLLGKDLVLLPQTYGPYRHGLSRWIAAYIIRNATHVLTRCKKSIQVIARTCRQLDQNKIIYCPDVAFTLTPVRPPSRAPEKIRSRHPGAKVVGINVSGLLYSGGYSRDNMFRLACDYRELIVQLITRLLVETDVVIVLIPHTYGEPGNVNSDPYACRRIQESLDSAFRDRVTVIEEEYDQSEIKSIIGACDYFVGSRMHACIAAISQNIPTIGIAYSYKFLGVFGSINRSEDVVDARKESMETIISTVLRRIKVTDGGSGFRDDIEKAKSTIHTTFERLLSETVS